ncbi:dihydroorotase [Candidatus Peregrinibacteria bacterium CG_4_9_14_0_2_um_filter_53_11]|nr:MAG: dihydroorotase [Candidatus Peregrinibacteria bacterium CG_4_9_14_0_2_um_filter_53_11]
MAFDLLLKNATLVLPDALLEGDCAIEGGQIVDIGELSGKAKREIDCTGKVVLPGVIDMHVHFRDPGYTEKEDFWTGSQAAAAAGITTVIDMPNTEPLVTTIEALEEKRKIVEAKSLVNFGLYFGATETNLDEVKRLKNVPGVKVCTAHTTGDLLVTSDKVLGELFKLDHLYIVHSEDAAILEANQKKYADSTDVCDHSRIRSAEAAIKSTKRILALAKKYDTRVHITHLSTKGEVDALAKAKTDRITADCTPHHLFFTEEVYGHFDTFVKVNPPLRTEDDREALWLALSQGLIDAIATDHAPHTIQEKSLPFPKAPSGIPGVETLLPLLLDAVNHGELALEDVAYFLGQGPAQILGLGSKGRITTGSDADLVIVDMDEERILEASHLRSKCGWSPFEGLQMRGWPTHTIINGHVVYENGKLNEAFRGKEITLN